MKSYEICETTGVDFSGIHAGRIETRMLLAESLRQNFNGESHAVAPLITGATLRLEFDEKLGRNILRVSFFVPHAQQDEQAFIYRALGINGTVHGNWRENTRDFRKHGNAAMTVQVERLNMFFDGMTVEFSETPNRKAREALTRLLANRAFHNDQYANALWQYLIDPAFSMRFTEILEEYREWMKSPAKAARELDKTPPPEALPDIRLKILEPVR